MYHILCRFFRSIKSFHLDVKEIKPELTLVQTVFVLFLERTQNS